MNTDGILNVLDVQKIDNLTCHICKIHSGNLNLKNSKVIAKIDENNRKK